MTTTVKLIHCCSHSLSAICLRINFTLKEYMLDLIAAVVYPMVRVLKIMLSFVMFF